MDAFDSIELTPIDVKQTYDRNPTKDAFDEIEFEESWGKSFLRTLAQIPAGITQAVTYPADLIQMIGTGDSLDEEEIQRLRDISKREGIPFDEGKYYEAVENAANYFPSQGNIERLIEEQTGAPLTPKTGLQKALRLGATAGKLNPGSLSQKAAAGVAAPSVSAGLQSLGVPEGISDMAGLAVSPGAAALTPKVSVQSVKKPSGLTERGFEKLQTPRDVSESKLAQINRKVEGDFRSISDKIIKESPVGKTFENLKSNPLYKQESRELIEEAQKIANTMTEKVPSKILKDELKNASAKQSKGFAPNEYDISYENFIKQAENRIPKKDVTYGQLVEQYRKNNQDLSEYFEPGSSKGFNRAKRDAILDSNRAITSALEKTAPNSELVPIFKEGNARWTKIMDAETIDGFVNDLFDGGIKFKKGKELFDDRNVERIFKRSFGEKYPQFEQLMKDLLVSEKPYNMLKTAKNAGFDDLFKSAGHYILHPTLAKAKIGTSLVREAFRTSINSLLDKPRLIPVWQRGLNEIKAGDFKSANNTFKALNEEIQPLSKEEASQKFIQRNKNIISK